MAVTARKSKNAVESLRDIVQDLLVPELKAIKAELESQRRENQIQFASIRTELNVKTDGLHSGLEAVRNENKLVADALRGDIEGLRVEMRIRDENRIEALQALRAEMVIRDEKLTDKLGTLLEVRERLAVLEDRAKHA